MYVCNCMHVWSFLSVFFILFSLGFIGGTLTVILLYGGHLSFPICFSYRRVLGQDSNLKPSFSLSRHANHLGLRTQVRCEGTWSMSECPTLYNPRQNMWDSPFNLQYISGSKVWREGMRERVAYPPHRSSLQNTLYSPFNLLVVEDNVWEPDVTWGNV